MSIISKAAPYRLIPHHGSGDDDIGQNSLYYRRKDDRRSEA
jgi:hypothetical protein